jgi:hypothetical protein
VLPTLLLKLPLLQNRQRPNPQRPKLSPLLRPKPNLPPLPQLSLPLLLRQKPSLLPPLPQLPHSLQHLLLSLLPPHLLLSPPLLRPLPQLLLQTRI